MKAIAGSPYIQRNPPMEPSTPANGPMLGTKIARIRGPIKIPKFIVQINDVLSVEFLPVKIVRIYYL